MLEGVAPEGLIETDGRVSKYDPKKASYFLDVTMSSADPGIFIKPENKFIQVVNNDEKEDRARILKEMGYDKNYDSMPKFDDYVIGL